MTIEIKSFYNQQLIKDKYLNKAILINKKFVSNSFIQAIGCHEELIIDVNNQDYLMELGIPMWLVRLGEYIYNNNNSVNKWQFLLNFLTHLPINLDSKQCNKMYHIISLVRQCSNLQIQETLYLRYSEEYQLIVIASIKQVIQYHLNCLDVIAAESARSAARSAAWSAAWSARLAAKSAAESAAESAAQSAAWSAAKSARLAAFSVELAAEAARLLAKSAAWSAKSAAWLAAESAAESAAWSAAKSTVRSAAWSARLAAESAAWSAKSAAESAKSAAESAAWKQEELNLINIFKEFKQ